MCYNITVESVCRNGGASTSANTVKGDLAPEISHFKKRATELREV